MCTPRDLPSVMRGGRRVVCNKHTQTKSPTAPNRTTRQPYTHTRVLLLFGELHNIRHCPGNRKQTKREHTTGFQHRPFAMFRKRDRIAANDAMCGVGFCAILAPPPRPPTRHLQRCSIWAQPTEYALCVGTARATRQTHAEPDTDL